MANEGTQTQENEALIQEMLRDAKKVELASELSKNPVVHRGDAELPAPVMVHEISSAGYVFVWDSRTGKKVPILYYMLPKILRQKREDGSYRFTTTDPSIHLQGGTIKCMLHLDDKNRQHYAELGFRACPKDNMPSLHQLRQHMIHKHPQEWATIEAERTDKEKAEDRQLQRLLLVSQQSKSEKSDEATKPTISKTPFVCYTCGMSFGKQTTLDDHKANVHKE